LVASDGAVVSARDPCVRTGSRPMAAAASLVAYSSRVSADEGSLDTPVVDFAAAPVVRPEDPYELYALRSPNERAGTIVCSHLTKQPDFALTRAVFQRIPDSVANEAASDSPLSYGSNYPRPFSMPSRVSLLDYLTDDDSMLSAADRPLSRKLHAPKFQEPLDIAALALVAEGGGGDGEEADVGKFRSSPVTPPRDAWSPRNDAPFSYDTERFGGCYPTAHGTETPPSRTPAPASGGRPPHDDAHAGFAVKPAAKKSGPPAGRFHAPFRTWFQAQRHVCVSELRPAQARPSSAIRRTQSCHEESVDRYRHERRAAPDDCPRSTAKSVDLTRGECLDVDRRGKASSAGVKGRARERGFLPRMKGFLTSRRHIRN
jgi:hypothetical protein